MKNTLRIAIVVSLFAAAKVIYYFMTRVTQKEVVAYVDSVDNNMSMLDKDVSSAILNLSGSSTAAEGESEIRIALEKIKAAKDDITAIKIPKNSSDFNSLREAAFAQLALDSAGVKDELGAIVYKLRPKEEPYEFDPVAMYLNGTMTMKKSPLNDSLEKVISNLTMNFETDKLEGTERYNNAKQALYAKYKIIRIPVFQ